MKGGPSGEWPVTSPRDLSVSIIESFKHCWLLAGVETEAFGEGIALVATASEEY